MAIAVDHGDGRAPALSLVRRLLSAPLRIKIMGIGFSSAVLAGSLTFLQARATLLPVLHDRLEGKLRSTGYLLQELLWPQVLAGRLADCERAVTYAREVEPDLCYVIVDDARGQLITQSLSKSVLDGLAPSVPPPATEGQIQVLAVDGVNVLDAQFPLQKGSLGRVRVGLTDRGVREALRDLTRSTLRELGLAMALSGVLALVLTRLIADPIIELERIAQRVGEGDFDARPSTTEGDEIGRLGQALTRMARRLGDMRCALEQRDAERALLVARTVESQEHERRSIALELHDRIGQSLMAALLALRAGEAPPGLSAQACTALAGDVEALAGEVRRMAWEMRPPNLGARGLAAALARYVREVVRPSRVEVDEVYATGAGLAALPVQVEETLFRVGQEALTNVIRHAKTDRASLVLTRERGFVLLIVEDHGVGFDPAWAGGPGTKGVGLVGMRERIAGTGGELTIVAAPGKGTLVRARIPIDNDKEESCVSAS